VADIVAGRFRELQKLLAETAEQLRIEARNSLEEMIGTLDMEAKQEKAENLAELQARRKPWLSCKQPACRPGLRIGRAT
jgi:hypothetical protein